VTGSIIAGSYPGGFALDEIILRRPVIAAAIHVARLPSRNRWADGRVMGGARRATNASPVCSMKSARMNLSSGHLNARNRYSRTTSAQISPRTAMGSFSGRCIPGEDSAMMATLTVQRANKVAATPTCRFAQNRA